jgi:hypothetical protein
MVIGLMPQHMAPSTKSEDTLSVAQDWFKEYASCHKACVIEKESPTSLPSRFLLVDQNNVRLVHSQDIREVEYATLSHCWSNIEILKLT